MATMLTKYHCDHCQCVHDDEDAAIECCPPSASEFYQCSVCHATFVDEWEADEHCQEHGDDEPDVPTPAELEAAGQQRLPL